MSMITDRRMFRMKRAAQLVMDTLNKINSLRSQRDATLDVDVKSFKASFGVSQEAKFKYDQAITGEMVKLNADIANLQSEANGVEVLIIPKSP